MTLGAQLFALVLTAATVVVLLSLVRQRKLRAKYALLWLVTGGVMVVLTAVPGLLDAASARIGVDYAPAALFTCAIVLLLLVAMHFSFELSRLEEKSRSLAEELALRTLDNEGGRRAADGSRRGDAVGE